MIRWDVPGTLYDMSVYGLLVTPVKQLFDAAARSGFGKTVLKIDSDAINDERFWDQLSQVRKVKRLLFQESVAFKAEDLPNIGLEKLEAISFHVYGRTPTAEEWTLLDAKQSVISGYLDGRLRWKLKMSRLRLYFTTVPVVFLVTAVFALAGGIVRAMFFDNAPSGGATPQGAYLYSASVILWTLALGGLGACAFLGTTMISENARMNGLLPAGDGSAKSPETDFDLTDRDLIWTRIVVGILFAFLLGIPLSAGSLKFVVAQIATGDITTVRVNADLVQTMALTLLPFVIGFSTTLVLGVMDRFVTAIRTVFGMTGK